MLCKYLLFFSNRPLGQGAFGEVYQGVLSNVTSESGNLSVAVKVGKINNFRKIVISST